MNTIKDLFQQAQLAEAAYANFVALPGNPIQALTTGGSKFSAAQATAFVAEWSVVSQLPDTADGFSGTLYKNNITGEYSFSLRGTQFGLDDLGADVGDIVADGVALDQVVDMYNYWQSLTHTGSYDAKRLTTLVTETLALNAAYLINSAAGLAYELSLRASGYIIDEPTRSVRRLETVTSNQLSNLALRSGSGKLSSSAIVNVDGHSLGGHLAMAYSLLFPSATSNVVAVNGAGFNFTNSNVSNLFTQLGGAPGFDTGKITNAVGSAAMNLVSQDWLFLQQPAGRNTIYTESASLGNTLGHGAGQMTDSLALYGLFGALDPALNAGNLSDDISTLTAILNASSNVAQTTLESALDDLRTLFEQNYAGSNSNLTAPPTTPDDRESLYANINALETWLINSAFNTGSASAPLFTFSVASLADTSAATLAALAQADTPEGLAYRYALVKANAFVVSGDASLYQAINSDDSLTLYDSINRKGNLTEQYLIDRSAYVATLLARNTQDNTDPIFTDAGGEVIYRDYGNGTIIEIRTGSASTGDDARRHIVFGGGVAETLSGASKDDRLYGGNGDDTLKGNADADYLEGNLGNDDITGGTGNDTLLGGIGYDTYHYTSGDGFDVILDSDNQGRIVVDGIPLDDGTQFGDSRVYKSADQHLYVFMQANTLVIDGRMVVREYDRSNRGMGLDFKAAPILASPSISRTILGDFAPKDINPETQEVEVSYDDLGNVVTDNVPQPGLADTLYGSGGNDLIRSGGGDDRINAKGGDDVIDGGTGRDQVLGSVGNDVLMGGADSDLVIGDVGDDRLYADSQVTAEDAVVNGNSQVGSGVKGDWLSGGSGDDIFIGGTANDVLSGGGGKDLLIAGAGDDTILGDIDWIVTSLDWTQTDSGYNRFFYPIWGTQYPADAAADVIYAGRGDDYVWSGAGNDVMFGEDGDDQLIGEDGNDIILGGAGQDNLFGENGVSSNASAAGNDYLDGGEGDDTLNGDGGDDVLIGGAGRDTLYGGEGKDTYVFNRGDGRDTVYDTLGENNIIRFGLGISSSDVTLRLGSLMLDLGGGDELHIGNFNPFDVFHSSSITDFEFADGSQLSSRELLSRGFDIVGTNGDDALYGTSITDRVYGLDGNDSLSGLDGQDNLDSGTGNDTVYGGDGSDNIFGGAGDDYLEGEGGDDNIDGGSGADVMYGGLGNDTYSVDASTDQVIEYAYPGMGIDTVVSSISYRLGGNVENLILAGTSALSATGNALDNILTGNSAANVMEGIDGNDTYVVDNTGDVVKENADAGNDTVQSSISYTLGFNVENLTLTGSDPLNGTGNNLSNILAGNSADNILAGATGNDTYLYNRGGGFDTLAEGNAYSGIDHVLFGAGITATDIAMRFSGNDLIVELDGGDILQLTNAAASITVEELHFSGTSAAGVLVIGSQGDDENMINTGSPAGKFLGFGGNDSMYGGVGDDVMYGGDGADNLTGYEGNNALYGGHGNDILSADSGNDVYGFESGDGIDVVHDRGGLNTLRFGAGIASEQLTVHYATRTTPDTVYLSLDYGAGDRVDIAAWELDDDTLVQSRNFSVADLTSQFADGRSLNYLAMLQRLAPGPTSGADAFVGSAGTDQYHGGDGADALYGQDGADQLFGDGGDDVLFGGAGDDVLSGGVGVDILNGGSGNNILYGNEGDDQLNGGMGNDWLVSGIGNDQLTGGGGGDRLESQDGNTGYYYAMGDGKDVIRDGGGYDSLYIGASLNDVYIDPNALSVLKQGNNLLIGIDVNNSLTFEDWFTSSAYQIEQFWFATQAAGDDLLTPADLNLRIAQSMTLTGTENTDVLSSGNYNDQLFGLGGNDTLTGLLGDDLLDGGAGSDGMLGGKGNDSYVVDNVGDVVNELAGQGTDTVQSAITYTLGANLENLSLIGNGAINGSGNTLNNVITGNGAANLLSGGAGADTMSGGAGDDTYTVDNTSDSIIEALGEGVDAVSTSVTYVLSANVENLTLSGSAAINATGNVLDNQLTGNGANNILTGGAGNDILNGAAGLDTMKGGTGNDTYVVGVSGDVVTELANEGADSVQSAITYTLGANAENLTLTGSAAINGTGNSANNTLIGNSAANILSGAVGDDVLDGAAGADTLKGGLGNDNYVFGTGDTLTELAGEGTDTVQSAITCTLATNIENLVLTGTRAVNGTGNTLNNVITGNSAANTLNGAAGSDTMIGGMGDDTYVIGVTGDVVTELAGEGTDTVQAALTYTLGANLENLTLTGTGAFNGTGNTLANLLTGNTGANTLTGSDGNDTLDGGAGADTLSGGWGSDTYLFARGYAADTLIDYDAKDANPAVYGATTDKLVFGTAIATDQLWFAHSGNNLNVSIIGTGDKVTLQNWYSGSAYQVDELRTADNHVLLRTQVEQLVTAMAAFSPPASGQLTLPPAYQTVLEPVIAANWQAA